MISFYQEVPFLGRVNNSRQRKLPVGTVVEVHLIKDGDYGPYARSFIEGAALDEQPIFLGLKHIDYVADVSPERKAEIEADRAAYLEARELAQVEKIKLGVCELSETGRALRTNVTIRRSAAHQVRHRTTFFPKSLCEEVNGEWYAPVWSAKQKAADVVYYWITDRGRKSLMSFEKLSIACTFSDGTSFQVDIPALHEAHNRYYNRR